MDILLLGVTVVVQSCLTLYTLWTAAIRLPVSHLA